MIRTEAELQREVLAKCGELGLPCFHVVNALGMARGWPDCTIIGRKLLFRELKNSTHKPTPAQRDIGRRLRAAGADWDIWRPGDWRSGRVEWELRNIL